MNEALSNLADDFFKNSLDSSPTSAIMRGYKEYFDQIEELTETRFDQNLKDLDKFEKRLKEIDFNNLSNKEKVTECWSMLLDQIKIHYLIKAGSLELEFLVLQAI